MEQKGGWRLFVGRLLLGDNVSAVVPVSYFSFFLVLFFYHDQIHLQRCPYEAASSTSESAYNIYIAERHNDHDPSHDAGWGRVSQLSSTLCHACGLKKSPDIIFYCAEGYIGISLPLR